MAIVLDGLVFGLQLAVIGVGLTLVFGLSGVLDLAYGAKIVAAGIVGASVIDAGLPPRAATLVVVAAAVLLALVIDRTVLAPVHRRYGEQRVVLSLLITLAVAIIIEGVVVTTRPFAALTLTVAGPPVEILGVRMRGGSLWAAVIAAIALLISFLLLHRTRSGRAIRSVIQDEEGARLCGVEPGRVRVLVVTFSGALAGIVAVTQSLTSSVGPADGFDLTILAVIVAVVGGLGRVAGAAASGLILGLVHALATATLGASMTWVLLLLAAMITILLRPAGLVGFGGVSRRHARQPAANAVARGPGSPHA